MSIGAIIMVGLPPTVGFISKWYLLLGIVESEKLYLLFVIILSTLLNASYYFPMIYKAYFEKEKFSYKGSSCENMILAFPVILIGFIAVFIFFKTDFIVKFITEQII
jgi:multicomponent Na+:H+ antiporter subunit D